MKPDQAPPGTAIDHPLPARVMARALEIVAQIERTSRLLRASAPARRQLGVFGRLALADDDRTAELPIEGDIGASVADARLTPVTADAVLVGRPDNYLRLRAFYLDLGLTLAVHDGWPPRFRPSKLHNGAAARRRLGDAGELLVPRPLEQGRGALHAWLLEDLVRGRPVTEAEWPAAAPVVFEHLTPAAFSAGVGRRPLGAIVSNTSLRSVLRVIEQEPDLEVDGSVLAGRVARLVARGGDVVVGLTHGDPGRRNVLRASDGRLALVDWEAARRRLLAHDATKLLEELPDPLALLEAQAERLPMGGADETISWRAQVAVACVVRLADYRRWFSRATIGSLRGIDPIRRAAARNRRRAIRLLDLMLEPDR